ncbi:MAG: DPP IV N-terminal domain-containing protein, partial [Sediminibacterium sp.]|nr:DPP IV N-terminal domain-containing protein [Sediminibacterium sp.]
MSIVRGLLTWVTFAVITTVQAQQKQISNSDLMSNKLPENLYNNLPTVLKWIDDEQVILYQKLDKDTVAKNYILDSKTGTFTETMMGAKTINGIEFRNSGLANKPSVSPFGKSVTVWDKDLFYSNNGMETRLTNDQGEEKNPTFSPDSNYIGYTKKNNLYSYDLRTKKEVQLTTDGTGTILNGYASWLYYEEIFGRNTRYRAFWWSPNSKTLAYMHFDESEVPMFPIYVSEGQHGYMEQTRYPLPGDKNPEVKIGMVSPDGGNTIWADFNAKDDQYLGWPLWKEDGNVLMVFWMNREQNNLKIFEVKPFDGSKKEWYNETQQTWIDLEDRVGGRVNFLKNDKGVIIQSDKSGWNHLYLYSNDGQFRNAITNGKFTVTNISLIDEKNEIVYFSAKGRENTARTDLYRVKFDGSDLKRLTFGEYNHAKTSLSPGGKYFITTYSNAATPTRMSLVDNNGKLVRELGDMKGAETGQYALAKTELIRIKSEDGLYDLPALVTWPATMDPNKKYPLLLSIYG